MRIFSVGGWPGFGSLVISTALLGIGLSGILITLLSDWVEDNAQKILSVCAITLPLLMTLAVIGTQSVPFNPELLASDKKQLFYIGLYYIIYGVPFFINAVFVGTIFVSMRNVIQKIYFWNMAGSGIGGFFIIIFMFFLPPDFLIIPVIIISIIAAFFCLVTQNEETLKIEIPVTNFAMLCVTSILSFILVFNFGGIRVSDQKAISYVRKYPDSKLVHHSFAPGGEYHVYYSKYFHFAPGLSDNAALNIPNMPQQPYWGLFIDGSGPIGIMGFLRENEKAYMDYLPMSAPYLLLDKPQVLLINLSGGINTQIARYKEASKIDILEPSSEIIKLLKYDPNITRFSGGLLSMPNIKVIQSEGRSWCAKHRNSYNLIEISLVDSVGLTDSGGYPVHEDFKWTVEAFKEYYKALDFDGILSVTVWDKLNPPRNVLKLSNTIVTALNELNIANPQDCFYSFGLLMSTSTILVKKGAFTEAELTKLNNFVESRTFELFYSPDRNSKRLHDANGRQTKKSTDALMAAYKFQFEGRQSAAQTTVSNADMYKAFFPDLLLNNVKGAEDRYIFDISAIRDEKPYYSAFLKMKLLPLYLKHLETISEDWGYLLLLAMLIQAVIFGLIVIILPLLFSHENLLCGNSFTKTLGVILYYAGLGLGFMLVEIFLIGRLGLFLANPTYSSSIVITVMLIFSALGNLVSVRFKQHRTIFVLISCILIAAFLAFYIFGLNNMLSLFNSPSLFWRVIASIAIIAPPSFFMGVPYPNGLDELQTNTPALLPWAWGMNGGLSVVGSALARVISVASGWTVLLFIAGGIYLMVGLLFRVNKSDTPLVRDSSILI
ncbi:hypothetical protein FACS1894190_06470 [Spirochaetia bacterium]|nr:hypothetical protein FACS1894190_06470 [Spirochaetia bacterium]